MKWSQAVTSNTICAEKDGVVSAQDVVDASGHHSISLVKFSTTGAQQWTQSVSITNSTVQLSGLYAESPFVLVTATSAAGPMYMKFVEVPTVTSIGLTRSSVIGGAGGAGSVGLSGPAPAGGTKIDLASSSTLVTPTPEVTVSEGQTATGFTFSSQAVSSDTPVTLTATDPATGATRSRSLIVLRARITSLVSATPTPIAGNKFLVTATLNGRVGAPVSISFSSTGPLVTPSPQTVPAGSSAVLFPVVAKALDSAASSATLTGNLNGSTASFAVSVQPPSFVLLGLSLTSVAGGNPVGAAVSLDGLRLSDTDVTFAYSNGAVTKPSAIKVPGGTQKTSFSLTTVGVDTTQTVNVSASALGKTLQQKLTVVPGKLLSFRVSPNSTPGGIDVTGTITLDGAAGPAGKSATMLFNPPLSMAATVSILPGGKSASFLIHSKPVSVMSNHLVKAKVGADELSATLTLIPPTLKPLLLQAAIQGGTTATGTVLLTGPAPSTFTINLSSNSSALTVPASVTIPAGARSVNFTATAKTVGSDTAVIVKATLTFDGSTATVNTTVLH